MTPSKSVQPPPVASTKSGVRTQQLRERLLQAAETLFMENGFEATSMGEIASLARASKETFYRHFPTKDELFQAVVLRRAESVGRNLGGALVSHDPPEKALVVFGELILKRIVTSESVAFHRVLSMERERFPDLLQLFRASGPHRVHVAITNYMQQQIAKGKLRKMNPAVAARQYVDLVAAEMIINANVSGKANPSQAEIKLRVKEAVECFLHGCAT